MFEKKKVVILSFENDVDIDAIGQHLQNIVKMEKLPYYFVLTKGNVSCIEKRDLKEWRDKIDKILYDMENNTKE